MNWRQHPPPRPRVLGLIGAIPIGPAELNELVVQVSHRVKFFGKCF